VSTEVARQTLTDVLGATLLGLGYDEVDITDTTMLVADLQLSSVDIVHVLATTEDRLDVVLELEALLEADGKARSDLSVAEIIDALTAAPSRP
jgi:acyl carrier protein